MTAKVLRGALAAILAAFLCLGMAPGAASAPPPAGGGGAAAAGESLALRLTPENYARGGYVPGEVVVMLEDPSPYGLARLLSEFSALLAADAVAALQVMAARPQRAAVKLCLRPGTGELEAARALMASPLVRAAEPNIIFRAADTWPDDPYFPQQWGLNGTWGVGAGSAWDLQRGSSSLTLAVVDTGVDYGHEDLLERCTQGWDYHNNDPDPMDDNGHGTMVAGIACAGSDNNKGVAGLDWRARIMPLKALGADGEGDLEGVVNSIYHAAAGGADVINLSLTSTSYSQELAYAVEYARSAGCVLAAAVGNEGDTTVNYPAGVDGVIGVASVGPEGRRSWFSNRGPAVDLAAPGETIWGPLPGNRYASGSGTSEATPFVSAAALLVLAEYPGSSPDEVWRRLKDSARDLGAPGYDEEYGWGLLDADGALRVPLVTVTSPQDFSYPASGRVSASASSANTTIDHMELHLDGELLDSYTHPQPGGSLSHEFTAWDLGRLAQGTHTLSVKAIGPGGREGEQAVTVYRNDSQPRPARDWYLAEGTTAWGFETWVLVQNPNPAPTSLQLTFMRPDGTTQVHSFAVRGNSRLTVAVNSLVPASDVSTHVHADLPVVVERSMYWGGRRGGHAAVGSNAPARDWYLAEGTTAWGFETWVLVQNPGDVPAAVQATFMKPGGAAVTRDFSLPARSRLTLSLNELMPASDLSTHVHADQPVVVERAVYWGGRDGGHAVLGLTESCATWYLAEGTTAWGFETWVLVQNPNPVPAGVNFVFMKPGGGQVRAARTVGAFSRLTLNVAEVAPGSDVSAFVRAYPPVIVERAMYWPGGGRARAEGHCSTGAMTAARNWYLAEGTTAWGFDEYVLLANPTARTARATLRFMRSDGSTLTHELRLGAGERITVHANEVDPSRDASVQVASDIPLVVERSMYWAQREGGSNALGVMRP